VYPGQVSKEGIMLVLCPRIDPLCLLAGCRSRQLNQGLVVALHFPVSVTLGVFYVIFWFMDICFVLFSSLLFVISTALR